MTVWVWGRRGCRVDRLDGPHDRLCEWTCPLAVHFLHHQVHAGTEILGEGGGAWLARSSVTTVSLGRSTTPGAVVFHDDLLHGSDGARL